MISDYIIFTSEVDADAWESEVFSQYLTDKTEKDFESVYDNKVYGRNAKTGQINKDSYTDSFTSKQKHPTLNLWIRSTKRVNGSHLSSKKMTEYNAVLKTKSESKTEGFFSYPDVN